MIFNKDWYLPFEDFFSHLPNDLPIENFGHDARIEALKFCNNKNVVIDIGAHIGISVKHWAKYFSTVYAFEPQQDHFDCLIENTKNLNNVKNFNIGLGNFDKTTLGSYRTNKNSGSFQLIDDKYLQPKNENKHRKFFNIEIKKLDSFSLDTVDLIKIDVEGWESEVLEGAVDTINRCKPVLMIEVLIDNPHKTLKSDYDVNNLYKIINKLNYKEVAHIKPDDKIFISNE